MKKTVSIIILVSMLLTLLFSTNISAEGKETTVGYLTFTEYDTYCEVTRCNDLKRGVSYIKIPSSVDFDGKSLPVTSIGKGAFSGGSSELTSVTIPDTITSIGEDAFYDCSGLKSVTIPDSVTSIGRSAFFAYGLESITVSGKNNTYHSSGNCLIETESKTLIAGCKNSVIPDDGSVTSIGDGAFEWCVYLTSMVIPDSVTSIGDAAFWYCWNLKNVTIPDSVTSIGDNAFFGCSNLTSVTIPDSVTKISDSTFSECNSLTSVIIPDGVTSIGEKAFSCCENLKTVYYKGSEEQWNSIKIDDCGNDELKNAEIIFNYAKSEPGDVNADGERNNKDVVAMFRYVSGNKDAVNNESECDVNGDGTVDNKDVVSLFRTVSSNITPVETEEETEEEPEETEPEETEPEETEEEPEETEPEETEEEPEETEPDETEEETEEETEATDTGAESSANVAEVKTEVDPTGMFEELFFYPNNDEEHEFDFSGDLAEDFRGLNIHVDRRIWGIYPGERFQLRFSSYYTYYLRISIKDVDVEITSGNEFATLDERGVFTAIKPGEVEITATLKAYPALTRKAILKIVEPQEKNDMWQGSGTFRDPYLVSTPQDFLNIQKISNYPNYDEVQICWFKQTNDIDFTGVDFEPGFFTHNYDGNGYKLKNITVNGDTVERDASVFGYAVCCVIKNVTVENFKYERNNMINAWEAAVFFGCTSSVTAYNCHAVNAYIDITDNEGKTGTAGGFLAHEVYDGSYINCSTDATVKGDMNIGGFYGTTESKHGIFVNCKASGTATAKQESLYGFDLFGGFTSQQTPGGKDNNNYIKTTEFYNCQWSQYDKMLEINNVITN